MRSMRNHTSISQVSSHNSSSDISRKVPSQLSFQNNRVDWQQYFQDVARAALEQAHELVPALLPGGVYGEPEYKVKNPLRLDKSIGSFSINIRTGEWADFATGDHGTDLVSLFAYINNQKQGVACRNLAALLGNQTTLITPSIPRNEQRSVAKQKPWPRSILPVPSHVKDLTTRYRETARWYYFDANAELLFIRVRTPDPLIGKKIITWTWCEERPGKLTLQPRAIYGLDRLAMHPEAPVIVTEGEPAADAAEQLFPGWIATTSGSATSHGTADWWSLRGRDVVIWPDADDVGRSYAVQVASHLLGIARSIRIVVLPSEIMAWCKSGEDEAGGWDLADDPPPGVDVYTLLNSAKPIDMDFPPLGGSNGLG